MTVPTVPTVPTSDDSAAVDAMPFPPSGPSALTSPEAILAACVDAVQQAVAVNAMQQQSAKVWMTASEPATFPATIVGGVDL